MYLNCHTWFSLMYGTLSPEQLFEEAKRHGVRKIILTDIHNTSAWPELLRICKEREDEYALEIALGIEFRKADCLLYIGLAENNHGFEHLCRFLSMYNTRGEALPNGMPILPYVQVIYPMNSYPPQLLPHEWIGVRPMQVRHLNQAPFVSLIPRCVIWQPVSYADKMGFNTHRLLRAIDHNVLLSKLANEAVSQNDEYMHAEAALLQYYWQYPCIISNTRRLLELCHFEMNLGENKNKAVFGASTREDHDRLRSLALEGFVRRYERYSAYAMQRLLRELDVIAERRFEAYFLIALDVVAFARHKNFAHVGRGSGANSMVAYCLGITEVDPIALDLYFERFLNPYRSSPPDFDIDFSWKERDEVTAYMLDKYGPEHAALLATHTTFQSRSVIRELGKVFGLPKAEIDHLTHHPEELAKKDEISRIIWRYAQRLHDMPRNLSIHAGGVLVTEKPIYHYSATDLPPKGFPITHFDMYGAEDLGIHKFDILSQRGLGHIKDAVAMVERNHGRRIDITRTEEFKQDPAIRKLLEQGKTMGAFYVESPAMRQLLTKLRCNDYITLVAASSIIRPGVARSGMMREYIQRHRQPQSTTYIHPKMKELMQETYGIMVYQEDVIKVAHHFAGLDLAEADVLRRGMSGKFRSRKEFQRVEQSFFENCKTKGYPEETYMEVWRQMESFSGYSFSKAHSASYAVESYQSLYLKAHYPLEFITAVINNFGGFYRTEFYVHEARMNGATIEAPCVNTSDYLSKLLGTALYIGFIHIKSLEEKLGQKIPEERVANGPFLGLHDFLARIPTGLEQACILVRIGAFRFTGLTKRALMWEVHLHFGKQKQKPKTKGLFDTPAQQFHLPELAEVPYQDAFDELELLGFALCHPFELLQAQDLGDVKARQLIRCVGRQVRIVGYLVAIKDTRTVKGERMHFGCFIDVAGDMFDTTHFPNIAKSQPFRGSGFYRISGRVVDDFGSPMIEVAGMTKLPIRKLDAV